MADSARASLNLLFFAVLEGPRNSFFGSAAGVPSGRPQNNFLTGAIVDVSEDNEHDDVIHEEGEDNILADNGNIHEEDENNNVDTYRNFSITPNYRVYFSNKYARGFFIEGFGMLHRYKDYYYDEVWSGTNNYTSKNITEFSLGISVGGKWVTKSGFVTEIFGGIGRNILNSNEDSYDPINIAGRIGVSVGKRF